MPEALITCTLCGDRGLPPVPPHEARASVRPAPMDRCCGYGMCANTIACRYSNRSGQRMMPLAGISVISLATRFDTMISR